MSRYETYHETQKKRRHGAKPYDRSTNETQPHPVASSNTNIFNPSGSLNNCTDMSEYYASGLPNQYTPPPAGASGRNDDVWKARLAQGGYTYSTNPPSEEYLGGPREAAVHYRNSDGVGHCVAVNGGFNRATYMYSDHQRRPEEDVTDHVRSMGRQGKVEGYITRDTFEDRERKDNRRYDSPDEERREGPVDDPDYGEDGDYEMDKGKREHNRWNAYRG